MWSRFGEPNSVLPPKHASVFSDALRYLSDVTGWEDWEGGETGITVFDRLTQGQKQVALLAVARALLQASAQPPKVTAYLAATVAAVYETLLDLIKLDIETDTRRTELRRGVLAALDEMGYWTSVNEARQPGEEQVERPSARCPDQHIWADLVEGLRTEVLEDYDFDLEVSFLDLDPEARAAMKQSLNIDPDCFTDIPEDPTPERFHAVRRDLHELARPGGQNA
jgi:hypothetical protein